MHPGPRRSYAVDGIPTTDPRAMSFPSPSSWLRTMRSPAPSVKTPMPSGIGGVAKPSCIGEPKAPNVL